MAGLGIGVCTLGVSCVIAYHTYTASLAAQQQVMEAQEANRMKRYELAKANPNDVTYIFAGYPEELKRFQDSTRITNDESIVVETQPKRWDQMSISDRAKAMDNYNKTRK